MEQTSQDLFKEAQEQSDTILGQLQTDLSTIMGPAEAGTIDQQLLQDRLKELGNPPARSANPETKKAYMDKLAVLMQETVREQAEQLANTAVNKTAATITQSVEKSVQKVKEAVQANKKQWEEILAQANNTTAGGSTTNSNQCSRRNAGSQLNASRSRLTRWRICSSRRNNRTSESKL